MGIWGLGRRIFQGYRDARFRIEGSGFSVSDFEFRM